MRPFVTGAEGFFERIETIRRNASYMDYTGCGLYSARRVILRGKIGKGRRERKDEILTSLRGVRNFIEYS